MSKREAAKLNGGMEIVDGPRPKRRREAAEASSDIDVTMSDPVEPEVEKFTVPSVGDPEAVKEQGLKIWQTVKDAVNKEGRTLSNDFLRKPSKRQYPDYYVLIKQPIALEDIKKQIESGGYASLEAVRQDFELCFSNAKQYNMKESAIWRDAKDLLKLVNKTYHKLSPDEDGENAGKTKAPNLNRLIKSRLQKLADKTDNDGRIMSTEFMELPSKKDWPIYYKDIKRPQCLENIFKRIKRKEYPTSADFAADVELVFSNAMTFNQEHTPIWEDALKLRDTFRLLMADLPAPFALPEYTKPSNTKIKIKPQIHAPVPAASSPPGPKPADPSLYLRVPAATLPAPSKVASPALKSTSLPVASSSSSALPQPTTATQLQTQIKTAAPQPLTQTSSYINATFSHYPNAAYIPPASTPPVPLVASSSTPNLPSQTTFHSMSNSPAPTPIHPSHQLKTVLMQPQPQGRPFNLDYRHGVKTWTMRMAPGTTGIIVKNVTFLEDEMEESSDEDEAEPEEEEEDEEDIDVEADAPIKNARKKGKGRGRGRPPKIAAVKTVVKVKPSLKKKIKKVSEVVLKVNGVVVKEKDDHIGEWDVNLLVGSNILEVGEVGGLNWKVFLERVAGS